MESSTPPTPDTATLTAENAKLREALKGVQAKAKDYVSSLDAKWRKQVEDLNAKVLSSETSLLAKDELHNQAMTKLANSHESTLHSVREELCVERDSSQAIAREEKRRADEAESREKSLLTRLSQLQAQVAASGERQAVGFAELNATNVALREECGGCGRTAASSVLPWPPYRQFLKRRPLPSRLPWRAR